MRNALVIASVAVAAAPLHAADMPVAGEALQMRASQQHARQRDGMVRLRDAGIEPAHDPRIDGAVFVLRAGVAPAQCTVAAELPAARWHKIDRAGAGRGWEYRDPAGRVQGIRRVLVRRGAVTMAASGASWPCGSTVPARLPVSITFRLGDQRWCAAFGGTVDSNRPGAFRARKAPAPPACPDADVTVADLNVLHGLSCPQGTDDCRFPERAALLMQWLASAGCPDVVTLQEVREAQAAVLLAALPHVCGGAYQALYDATNRVDDAMVLSRVPAFDIEVVPLAGNFRNVLRARLDHPAGPVEVFTTHLAASLDGARRPCDQSCPAECLTAGASTLRECQAVQVANMVETKLRPGTLAVVAGDLNEPPGSFAYHELARRGWTDTHLAAGNPECDAASGVECTSGRDDASLAELESPDGNEIERIDYVFVTPRAGCHVEPAGDPDGDGTKTGLFADRPNPFGPACGPVPAPICWPSDHVGAQLDLECR